MKFKLHPEKGLLVSEFALAYPLSEEVGQAIIGWSIKSSGKLPPIVEKDGEQYVGLTMPEGTWGQADKLLGRGVIVDGVLV